MITVTGHRVLIKEDPVEKRTKGGLYVAVDEKLERASCQRGIIIAVGPDCWKAFRKIDGDGIERNGEPWAKVGDYVVFARHAGRFIEDPVTNELFMIMNDEDILGLINEGDNVIPDHSVRNKVIEHIDI